MGWSDHVRDRNGGLRLAVAAVVAVAFVLSASTALAQSGKPRDGRALNQFGSSGRGIRPNDTGTQPSGFRLMQADGALGPQGTDALAARYDIDQLGGWGIAFFFGGTGPVPGSIDFTHPTNVTLNVTDAFCTGDAFRILDRGRVVLETPRVGNDAPDCLIYEDDPNQAFLSRNFSHGTVVLPAGSHSLTIEVIDSPYGAGGAFLEVLHLGPTVNPNRQLGGQVHLPILNFLGQDDVCESWIEVQNVGCENMMAALVTWGEPGFCPPQSAGPLKVECTGLLKPGTTWNMYGAQVPTGSKSGILFKLSARQLSEDGIDGGGQDDVTGALVCETLFFNVVGDADDYRRFKKAYDEGLVFDGIDMALARGSGALAVDVHRTCPSSATPGVDVTSKYNGIAGDHLGVYDDVYGGYSFYVPLAYASLSGMNSIIYIQNGGLMCSSIEIWFKQLDDCLRASICDIATLAPGETYQLDANDCVGPDFQGSAWIRSTQKMGIVVDITAQDTLMTYVGEPGEINYSFDPNDATFTSGNQVAFAPLTYSEYQGWDTGIQVQNLSAIVPAKVKVYFLDRKGGIITTLVDWVCPRGSQTFFLPIVAGLPGNWVGSARVESQEWITPGGPSVLSPNIVAVAMLIKYSDTARTQMTEAIAYNLLPEHKIYDWQIGGGTGGGLDAGVGLIAIPSLLKDLSRSGLTSELAITNVVPKPGFTDLIIYIYDQNGLLDYVCQKLNEKQVEYIDLQTWGYINNGFKGSAIISAWFWEHDVFSGRGQFERNLVGLGAVAIERRGGALGEDVPGDEAAGDRGIPFAVTFDEDGEPMFEYCFMGPLPLCVGFPDNRPVGCPNSVTADCANCPVPIPAFGAAPPAVLNVRPQTGCTIADVNIRLDISHTWINDLNIDVSSEALVGVTIVNQICGAEDNIRAIIDSQAATPIGSVCPPAGFAAFKPGGPGVSPDTLDQFDGTDPGGQWSLDITDLVGGDAGTINDWSVDITYR